jgi:MATE family multidrug resistance protein
MEVDAITGDYASTYFFILIWGAPAVLANYAVCGWLLGMQNSRATMWISLLINISNIAASCTLVYVFNLGIVGVAVGTLFAQWLGLAFGIFLIARHYNLMPCPLSILLDGNKLKRFFSINADIFLRTLCIVTITMWFTRTGASQGAEMLAVNALLMQFFTLFSFFMDGFGFAGEAMAGKYIGASDMPNLHKSVNWLCIWGAAIAVIFTALYTFGGSTLLHLLSNDTNVTATAHEYMAWVIAVPTVGFLAFTWDGIFIGATATRSMLLSILLASTAFFAVYFIAYPTLQNHGLWLAFICYLFTRAAVLSVIGQKYRK